MIFNLHDQVPFPNRSCDIGQRQRPEIARLRGEKLKKRASSVRDLTGISSGNSAAVLCRGVNSEDSGTISDATSKNCRDTNWHSRLWLETEAATAAEASHSMLRPKKIKKKIRSFCEIYKKMQALGAGVNACVQCGF